MELIWHCSWKSYIALATYIKLKAVLISKINSRFLVSEKLDSEYNA